LFNSDIQQPDAGGTSHLGHIAGFVTGVSFVALVCPDECWEIL
jgi:membrane associated rhomboid family serine protease